MLGGQPRPAILAGAAESAELAGAVARSAAHSLRRGGLCTRRSRRAGSNNNSTPASRSTRSAPRSKPGNLSPLDQPDHAAPDKRGAQGDLSRLRPGRAGKEKEPIGPAPTVLAYTRKSHDEYQAGHAAKAGDAVEREGVVDLVVEFLEQLRAELALGLFFRGQAVVGAEADVGDGDRDWSERAAKLIATKIALRAAHLSRARVDR